MTTTEKENNNEEQMQQKYLQFQMMQQQIEQLSQQMEYLNQQNAELEISINAIKELGETKINNQLLAPIADGIFLKGELKDNQKLVVNVGSDVTVERTVPEVVKLLEEQKVEIEKKLIGGEEVLQQLSEQAMRIYQEVEESVK